ncbi:hypothetical protein Vadar_033099 [Vaccinium darrowii]|uniref:Uncharacterized protein n=1 Tax=Vaccinium darrowii TaxID=229202 RepID=A0ACB7XLI2_9ERIC|nr:hypothetical protein Vadar_033099 [Vaccinium darrowii]
MPRSRKSSGQSSRSTNDDGKISASELSSSLGHGTTLEEIHAMIHEVSGDSNNHIIHDEFIDSDCHIDLDRSGLIFAEELLNVMRSFGEQCSIPKCRKMIGRVDRDDEGMFDFDTWTE